MVEGLILNTKTTSSRPVISFIDSEPASFKRYRTANGLANILDKTNNVCNPNSLVGVIDPTMVV
jgi:hypothetical protein